MKTLRKNSFSYKEVDYATRIIAIRVQDKVNAVVGISRGGLTPAVILSHRLGLPLYIITVQTRDGNRIEVGDDIKQLAQEGTILVVDDINDSGNTFRIVKEQLGNGSAIYAALCSRYDSTEKDIIAPVTINNDEWISFPWEVPKQSIALKHV